MHARLEPEASTAVQVAGGADPRVVAPGVLGGKRETLIDLMPEYRQWGRRELVERRFRVTSSALVTHPLGQFRVLRIRGVLVVVDFGDPIPKGTHVARPPISFFIDT